MIQVFKPKIRTAEVIAELAPIFDSGWIGLGPRTKEFENKIASFLNTDHFIATNGCTGALHMAIRSLDLPRGSKILTTPITFVSSNHAILYEGHLPVFCDVEPITGVISVESIEKTLAAHPDAKAIMVVHLGGYPCDMDAINDIAAKHGIEVIEDCAHAFGAKYNGRMIGDSNNLCAFSFQAVKNLPVGDGGGIATKDPIKAARFRRMVWLGADKTTIERSKLDSTKQSYNWDYEIVEVGYKYHFNDILATIGLNQLKYIIADNQRRRDIALYYRSAISADKCMKPSYNQGRESSYHFLPIAFYERDEIYKKLTDNQIYPGMHYKRNDNYEVFLPFKDLIVEELKGVDWYERHELTLPIHLHLTDEDLKRIVDIING